MLDVSHDKHPVEGAVESQVEGEKAVAEGCDARVVDCLQCNACTRRGKGH